MALDLGNAIYPKSMMPPGGSPADDEALWAWVNRYCERVNAYWMDRHFPNLPDRELMPTWRLIGHLYKFLIGWEFPEGSGPSRAHRIRFVAIQYRIRPGELETEARRYARELYEKATCDDGGREDGKSLA